MFTKEILEANIKNAGVPVTETNPVTHQPDTTFDKYCGAIAKTVIDTVSIVIKTQFDPTNGLPVGSVTGDIYLSITSANGWIKDNIYSWSGTSFLLQAPIVGLNAWIIDTKILLTYSGSEWVSSSSSSTGVISVDGRTGVVVLSDRYASILHSVTENAINGLIKCDGNGNYSSVVDNSLNWNTSYTVIQSLGTAAFHAATDFESSNTNLTSIAGLGNSSGWLYNNGAGVFAYSTPTYSDVGADISGAAVSAVNTAVSGAPNYGAKFVSAHIIEPGLLYDDGFHIGIGTINPVDILDIHSSFSGTSISNIVGMYISNDNSTSGNYAGVLFSDGNVGGYATGSIGTQLIDRTNHYGDMVLATRSVSGFTEKMRITGSGYIGIGTAIPGVPLDVVASNTTIRAMGTSNNDSVTLALYHSNVSADQIWQLSLNGSSPVSGAANKDFTINDGPGKNYVTFKSNGNVLLAPNGDKNIGIGLIAPNHILEVKDEISVLGSSTSYLYLNSGGSGKSRIAFGGGVNFFAIRDLTAGSDRFQITSDGAAIIFNAPTISAPAYVKGGLYFDTTLNKLRVGGATGWETVTSV